MYSKEERQRAVELFVETGMSYTAVKNALGYPSQWSLDRWYEDFLARGFVKERRTKWFKFSDDQKKTAVAYYLEHDKHLSNTVKALGYPSRTLLCSWIDELAPGERKKTKSHKRVSSDERAKALIEAYCSPAVSVTQTIESIDIDKVTFYNWRKELLGGGAQAVVDEIKDDNLSDDIDVLKEQVEKLKAEAKRYKMEAAVWQAAAEIVKKDLGIDLRSLSNKNKTLVVDALRDRFFLSDLLVLLCMSRSSYYYQKEALAVPDKYADLRIHVVRIFDAHDARWGSERIWAELRKGDNLHEPMVVSEKVVRRIMKEEDLAVVYAKKKKNYHSYKGEYGKRPENLVQRNFHAEAPNKLWLTDLTQFTLPGFKCYLSPIIDCFDGKVVAHRLSRSPDGDLVYSMLDSAIATLRPDERPLCHSDGGIHYWWTGWISRCDSAHITRSMSKKGCSPDNSACEGFFGRLKNEFFYHKNWDGVTYEKFAKELDDYIQYYNEGRIKKSLGWMSPMEYRKSLGLSA